MDAIDDGHNDVTVTEPTVESAAAAPPGRSRLAVAMLVVAGLLVIGAGVFGVLGYQAKSDAADARDRTAAAVAHRRSLARQQDQIETEHRDLEAQLRALPDKYDAVGTNVDGLVDAHNHYIDIANRSVALYNQGDTAGAIGLLRGDGATALADLMAKKTTAQQTVQAAEDALHQIQEAL